MIRRILFVIVYALCLPIVMIMAFSIVITGPIAIVIYIIKGDDQDTLMDFILAPFVWAIDLPYRIFGE